MALTEYQIEKIRNLRESGYTMTDIREETGYSLSTIEYWCQDEQYRKNRLKFNKQMYDYSNVKNSERYKKTRKNWYLKNRERLLKLAKEKYKEKHK